jgi:hypothetical protein
VGDWGRAREIFGRAKMAHPLGSGRWPFACRGMNRAADHRMRATWKPHEKHGELTERSDLPSSVYAFPDKRKEPMTDASHVRNAIARFDQVRGVSDDERDLGFANIKKAAGHYGVDITEADWKELGPSTGRPASAARPRRPRRPLRPTVAARESRTTTARHAAGTRKEDG